MKSYLRKLKVKKDKAVALKVELGEGTDKAVKAGAQLSGNVLLEVANAAVQGDMLVLSLQGTEKTATKRSHVFFSENSTLSDLSKQTLNRGSRSFPFSFDLPESLPSSINIEGGFAVEYKLTATLGTFSGVTDVAVEAAPLQTDKYPHMVEPESHTLNSKKSQDQGSLMIGAHVFDSYVRKGDCATIAISCRNNAAVDIQRVEVKLVQLLQWDTKEGQPKTRQIKDTLVEKHDVALPGVQKENKFKEDRENMGGMRSDLVSEWNTFELFCPSRARSSYSGNLVNISHHLKIKFITTNKSGNHPCVEIPLTIGVHAEIPPMIFCVPLDMSANEKNAPPVEKINLKDYWNEDSSTEETVDETDSEAESEDFYPSLEEMLVEGIVEKSCRGDMQVSLRNMLPLPPPPLY